MKLILTALVLVGSYHANNASFDDFRQITNVPIQNTIGVADKVQGDALDFFVADHEFPDMNDIRQITNTTLFETMFNAEEVERIQFDREDVTFCVYDRNSPNTYIPVNPQTPSRLANKQGRIYFIIHGWLENRMVQWYKDLKNVLLKKDPYSYVVQVDWRTPALQVYGRSASNTEEIGEVLAALIHKLVTEYEVPVSNFVLIGHSLGGHVVGWAGKKYKELSYGEKLPRIIALDPAGPLFSLRNSKRRLHHTDAEVVHVIHTDATKCGLDAACGTVDFYPNGGQIQPGCISVNSGPVNITTCSHQRSWMYFIEAVNKDNSFAARECSGWSRYVLRYCDTNKVAYLGDLSTTATGKYYLKTNRNPLYSKS